MARSTANRIICVGNAALDRIHRIETFPPQPVKLETLEFLETGGGMAANAAVAAARLGGAVELWSRVGQDLAGETIRQGLADEGIDVRWVRAFAGARSPVSSIIVDGRGERLIVGNRAKALPRDTNWLPLDRVSGAGAVLGDLRWMEAVQLAFSVARQAKVPTVLDADLGGGGQLPTLLLLADYAIFSAPALKEFVTAADDWERLEKVLDYGPRHAGVTRGADGYLWLDADGGWGRQPAYQTQVVDTTGAGDAFHGAFAFMLAEGQPSSDCARVAAAVGAMKCTRLGGRAGLPTRDAVHSFLKDAKPLPLNLDIAVEPGRAGPPLT